MLLKVLPRLKKMYRASHPGLFFCFIYLFIYFNVYIFPPPSPGTYRGIPLTGAAGPLWLRSGPVRSCRTGPVWGKTSCSERSGETGVWTAGKGAPSPRWPGAGSAAAKQSRWGHFKLTWNRRATKIWPWTDTKPRELESSKYLLHIYRRNKWRW